MTAADGYDIEAVRREWIGRVVASSQGRYPVEHDPIRRWCHMVGDTNPLHLDPDAGVVVPVPLVAYFAGAGPWPPRERTGPGFTYGIPTPGDRGINLGTSWDYLEPVRVGDRLRAEVNVTDVYLKPIRLDPLAVWIVTTTEISRDDTVVMRITNTVVVHRSPAETGAAS